MSVLFHASHTTSERKTKQVSKVHGRGEIYPMEEGGDVSVRECGTTSSHTRRPQSEGLKCPHFRPPRPVGFAAATTTAAAPAPGTRLGFRGGRRRGASVRGGGGGGRHAGAEDGKSSGEGEREGLGGGGGCGCLHRGRQGQEGGGERGHAGRHAASRWRPEGWVRGREGGRQERRAACGNVGQPAGRALGSGESLVLEEGLL